MPLTVARNAGFCSGVRQAVDKAMEAARQAKRDHAACHSLGEIIHNPSVVDMLRREGVTPVSSPEDAGEGVLILRSHGVSSDIAGRCARLGLRVVDCTCPYVRNLHDAVAAYSEHGLPVILMGDAGHPEVLGTAGWCRGPVYIVSGEEDALALPMIGRAMIVAQTTFPEEKWQALLPVLLRRVSDPTVRCTICAATRQRQEEARRLALASNRMIVVGGRTSANTRKLYEACSALCAQTILVERAAEIPSHFANIHSDFIGIAAGASTPDWSLKEVVNAMNDMENKDQVLEPNAVAEPSAEAAAKAESAPVNAPAAETAAKAPAPKPELSDEEKRHNNFMADVEATLVRIRPGQTVAGRVVQVTDSEVCVNIGYKSDGLIKREDLVDTDVKLGEEIDVEVVKVNDGEGNVILSQRNVINRKAWDALMVKYEAGEYVEGVGKEAVKGGLIALVDGVRAFVPASLLARRYVEKISQFIDQPMRLKIIEVDKAKKRIVCSRKDVLIEEEAVKKAAAWEKIKEGEVITGVVRRFAEFGAFVDLGGVDGLIHITDMAWHRVGHPSEIFTQNQQVQVKVLSVDPERERIQLGYKQLQAKPWDDIEAKYPVGLVLERKVVRIRPFGAFIELEPGVDGLVHISQVSLNRVNKVEDALTEGQMVHVKVLAVDPAARRISLSIREVLEDDAFNYSDELPGGKNISAEDTDAASPEDETAGSAAAEQTPAEEPTAKE